MAGSKGCHDDVAAAIIFVFNSLAMVSLTIPVFPVSIVFICARTNIF